MIIESRQKRVLLIIITILFLANIATLIIFFVGGPIKKKHGRDYRKEKMQGYLKKELGFNDQQLNTYQTISNQHRQSIDTIYRNMRREKEIRFEEMSSQNFSDSSIGQSAARIAENQKMLEVKMLKHLREVRALGNVSQRIKFDTGFLRYMNRNKSRNKN